MAEGMNYYQPRGYKSGHWEGCSCADCLTIYEQHNSGDHWCACNVCVKHNLVTQEQFQMANGTVVEKVATVNFCDRCDSMGKSNAMGSVQFIVKPGDGWTKKEICPGCVGDLMYWLNEDVITAREKAYRDPWQEDKQSEEQGEIITTKNLRKLLAAIEAGDKDDEPETS